MRRKLFFLPATNFFRLDSNLANHGSSGLSGGLKRSPHPRTRSESFLLDLNYHIKSALPTPIPGLALDR